MDTKEVVESFAEMASDYENAVDSEMSTFWGLNYDVFIDSFLESINLFDGASILDLATGTAVIPRKLALSSKHSFKIIGLDLTYEMVNTAKSIISKNGVSEKINLTCGNATMIPFGNETFDAITCALATHHMNAATLISEIWRVLKPGGKLFITDVGMAGYLRLPLIGHLVRLGTYLYFHRKQGSARARAEMSAVSNVLTPEEWGSLIKKNEMKDIKIQKIQSKYFWVPPPVQISAKK